MFLLFKTPSAELGRSLNLYNRASMRTWTQPPEPTSKARCNGVCQQYQHCEDRQEEPWSLLAGQFSQIGEFRVQWKTLCPKIRQKTPDINLWNMQTTASHMDATFTETSRMVLDHDRLKLIHKTDVIPFLLGPSSVTEDIWDLEACVTWNYKIILWEFIQPIAFRVPAH